MSARRRRTAHPPMTAVAMPLDKLDLWLQGRTGAAATNLSMLDGFVTAIVAGPVSMDPPEWICPLLGIEIDAFNHGGTPEFAAISAVAVRHTDRSMKWMSRSFSIMRRARHRQTTSGTISILHAGCTPLDLGGFPCSGTRAKNEVRYCEVLSPGVSANAPAGERSRHRAHREACFSVRQTTVDRYRNIRSVHDDFFRRGCLGLSSAPGCRG
jgi:Uncharacterised protein family (UPF0149)